MESGEVMNLNWNRISMLTQLSAQTKVRKAELDMRISFQNHYASENDEEKRQKIAKEIEETLTEEMAKSIRSFMKKK